MSNGDEEKRKKEIRENVSKKLMLGQMKHSYSQDTEPKKKELNELQTNTSGSYDFRDNWKPSVIKKTKKITRPIPKKDSVFNELGKIPMTNRKIVGNATEMIPEEKLKVNKKYQNRVNTILGK